MGMNWCYVFKNSSEIFTRVKIFWVIRPLNPYTFLIYHGNEHTNFFIPPFFCANLLVMMKIFLTSFKALTRWKTKCIVFSGLVVWILSWWFLILQIKTTTAWKGERVCKEDNTCGLERLKFIPLSTSSDSDLWHFTVWSSIPVSSIGTLEHFLPENGLASISSSVDSPSETTSCWRKKVVYVVNITVHTIHVLTGLCRLAWKIYLMALI